MHDQVIVIVQPGHSQSGLYSLIGSYPHWDVSSFYPSGFQRVWLRRNDQGEYPPNWRMTHDYSGTRVYAITSIDQRDLTNDLDITIYRYPLHIDHITRFLEYDIREMHSSWSSTLIV